MNAKFVYVIGIGDHQYAVPSPKKLTIDDAFGKALEEHEAGGNRSMGVIFSFSGGDTVETFYRASEAALRKLGKWGAE